MSERRLLRIDGMALPSILLIVGIGILLPAAVHHFWDCLCWHLWILVFPV